MNSFNERIKIARKKINETGAVIIGAGAGLSAAAGIDYSGPKFKKQFADYIERYHFPDLYSSSFYDFSH